MYVWIAATLTVAALLCWVVTVRHRATRLSRRIDELQREMGVRECIERQLQASQSNLQMATDASGVGTWYWDLASDELSCSDQAVRLFGLTNTGKIFKSPDFVNAIHPDDQDRVLETVANAFREASKYHVEYRVFRPDTSVIWLATSGRALKDPDGEVRRVAGITVDVTDRKRLEESFYQAQKMEAVGRLAGGVAHDFNNMLGVISAYAELLREEPSLSLRASKRVDEILSATQRANALTRQLLAFSRKQVISPTTLDLNAVVYGVKDMLQRLVGEDVRISVMATPKLPPIKADRGQLEQVLLNFAANSRDAMPKGGRFTLRTSLEPAPADLPRPLTGDCVCLEVSDTGDGMSPEVMKHIFEPFYTTKSSGKGTGLGLATVYGVVEQAHGTIRVESAPGKGTTFRVYLPAMPGQVAEAANTDMPKAPVSVKASVLLVEDEQSLREVLTEFMQTAGVQVTAVSSGREAVARINSDAEVDILLTDLVMPEMDGRSLAQIARTKRPSLQIIYMSGHTNDTLTQKELVADGLPYLQKPFTRADLLKALTAVLKQTA
ncbi:PAS/PAC sensor hybrid histidine kinase [Candidatus Koribacter versatilis Ellin345]|uniref:histidine kinase n=1 Tax=Koribacter versatilis (strain Ellin345) TaxID=204669 RepID=Q1INJ5_KORVE|nr:ATP-binding protein [Candidatus Koribacter versatilis]ABF41555.1 PAS/PAC sensor hybrid histidine kinase [Candidatus Koribacter versatilis Ellin345]